MNTLMSKICLSLLICSLLSTKEVYSQSCSWPPPGASGGFTNGPSSELITANDGVSLLGIRVLWTIKSEYLICQFTSMSVRLNSGGHTSDITLNINDSSADFFNLDCNTEYTPGVSMLVSEIRFYDVGDSLFFGASTDTRSTAPSQLLRVCVGLNSSLQGGVNISWDLLPCHLQNGADITGYIIQYNRTSDGEAQNISSSDIRVDCDIESGGRYRCLLPSSLSTTEVPYSFQVAAVNRYGAGPFSGQVMGMISSSMTDASNCYTITQTTEASHDTTTEKILSFNSSHSYENNSLITAVTRGDGRLNSTSPTAWIIVAGSLFVIMIILVGVIINMSVTLNCILWKRLKLTNISKTDQTNAKLDESEIDMKECSAYGHVTSTKTTSADEQHVYESTK